MIKPQRPHYRRSRSTTRHLRIEEDIRHITIRMVYPRDLAISALKFIVPTQLASMMKLDLLENAPESDGQESVADSVSKSENSMDLGQGYAI